MRPENPGTPSMLSASLLAIVNATIIGLSFLFAKVAVTTAGAIDTLAWRFLFAFTVFCCAVRSTNKPIRFQFRTMRRLLPLALCYPLAFFLFQAYGLLYATSSEAGILTATAPILTAILAAVCIKEKTNLRQYASISLSVAGVVYMTLSGSGAGNSGSFLGYTLILLSCCASAGYAVLNRVSVRSFGATEITFYLMLVGVVFFVPLSIGTHCVNGTIGTILQPLCHGKFVASVLFLGLFSSLLTTLIASIALKRLTSAQLSASMNIATAVAVGAGWLFLHENIRLDQIIGSVMILAGVYGTSRFRRY